MLGVFRAGEEYKLLAASQKSETIKHLDPLSQPLDESETSPEPYIISPFHPTTKPQQ